MPGNKEKNLDAPVTTIAEANLTTDPVTTAENALFDAVSGGSVLPDLEVQSVSGIKDDIREEDSAQSQTAAEASAAADAAPVSGIKDHTREEEAAWAQTAAEARAAAEQDENKNNTAEVIPPDDVRLTYSTPETPVSTTQPEVPVVSIQPEPHILQCIDVAGISDKPPIIVVEEQFGKPVPSDSYGFGSLIETVLLIPQETFESNNQFQYQAWQKYLECFGNLLDAEYFRFRYIKPMRKTDLDKTNGTIPFYFAEVNSSYNFYIEEYERILKGADERYLPNAYVVSLLEREALHKHQPNPRYKNLISLFGEIDVNPAAPKGQYFDKYARAYGRFLLYGKSNPNDRYSEAASAVLKKQYSNLLIPYEEIQFINENNSDKYTYPMHVDINFSTDTSTAFADILKESNLMQPFMAEVTEKFITNQYDQTTPVKQNLFKLDLQEDTANKVTSNEIIKVIDLGNWLDKVIFNESAVANAVDLFKTHNFNLATTLGEYYPPALVSSEDSTYKLHKQLLALIFSSKLQEFITKYRRKFTDVYYGKPAHAEAIFYRISKYVGVVEAGKPASPENLIQSTFVANASDIDIYSLADTQVRLGVDYHYEIVAYYLVVGTKLTRINTYDAGEKAAVRLVSTPTLKVVELPYYEENTIILDSPPMRPQVDFVAYRDFNNRVLINLNQNSGVVLEDPINIEEEDAGDFGEIRRQQKCEERNDSRIRFASDDYPTEFEVYRIEKKPVKYSDFKGGIRAHVKTDFDLDSLQKATSASLIDEVKPNTKYYYMVRCIDVHGKKSNPSSIYEIEIIDNDGFIYHSFKAIELEPPKQTMPEKGFKKQIKISPTLSQLLINEQKSLLDNVDTANGITNVILGVREESLWGETFKFRITSKHTGKKIDVNIKFVSEFDAGKTLLDGDN